jgi:hypothetical protein
VALPVNYPSNYEFDKLTTSSIGTTPVAAYGAMPYRGKVSKIRVTLKGAITTANASLAVTIGGTTIGGSPFAVPFSGSGAGVSTDFVVSNPAVFNEADSIVITPSGATGSSIAADFYV